MTDKERLEQLIFLIESSPLDQTIKDILVRDLQSEGPTPFLLEQIIAYCDEGIKQIDAKMAETLLQPAGSESANDINAPAA